MASSFVLGCGAQHQLSTTGSSSSLLCLPSVPGPTVLGSTWEDIPRLLLGQEGQEHPIWEKSWWEAQSRAQGPCSCLRPSQQQQVFYYAP